MNIKIDVDLTPEEMRRLMGLPDVHAFQQELLDKMREQMVAGADGYDAATLFKPFMENAFSSMQAFQKLFGEAVGKGSGATGNSKE